MKKIGLSWFTYGHVANNKQTRKQNSDCLVTLSEIRSGSDHVHPNKNKGREEK